MRGPVNQMFFLAVFNPYPSLAQFFSSPQPPISKWPKIIAESISKLFYNRAPKISEMADGAKEEKVNDRSWPSLK